MRFLVKTHIPVEAGNTLVRDPNFGKTMQNILADLRPEATYYTVEDGQRTVYFVITLKSADQIPSIVEPLWLSLKADVEFIPAMDQAEFTKAVPSIERATKRY